MSVLRISMSLMYYATSTALGFPQLSAPTRHPGSGRGKTVVSMGTNCISTWKLAFDLTNCIEIQLWVWRWRHTTKEIKFGPGHPQVFARHCLSDCYFDKKQRLRKCSSTKMENSVQQEDLSFFHNSTNCSWSYLIPSAVLIKTTILKIMRANDIIAHSACH